MKTNILLLITLFIFTPTYGQKVELSGNIGLSLGYKHNLLKLPTSYEDNESELSQDALIFNSLFELLEADVNMKRKWKRNKISLENDIDAAIYNNFSKSNFYKIKSALEHDFKISNKIALNNEFSFSRKISNMFSENEDVFTLPSSYWNLELSSGITFYPNNKLKIPMAWQYQYRKYDPSENDHNGFNEFQFSLDMRIKMKNKNQLRMYSDYIYRNLKEISIEEEDFISKNKKSHIILFRLKYRHFISSNLYFEPSFKTKWRNSIDPIKYSYVSFLPSLSINYSKNEKFELKNRVVYESRNHYNYNVNSSDSNFENLVYHYVKWNIELECKIYKSLYFISDNQLAIRKTNASNSQLYRRSYLNYFISVGLNYKF